MRASLAATVQVSRRAIGSDRLLLAALLPDPEALAFDEQMASVHAAARDVLAAEGLGPGDVIHQRLFLRDVAHHAPRARELLAAAGLDRGALTLVGQPPAQAEHLCAMQILASRAEAGAPGAEASPSIRRLSLDGSGMAWITGCAVAAEPGVPRGMTAEQEAAAMYDQAARALAAQGLTFRQVIRTWIYVREIDRDYGALNQARRAFYRAQGVAPPPASTGIGGVPEQGSRFSLDLLALACPGSHPMAGAMHARSMNEAPTYGADFSRGTRVPLNDRALLFISGTASIDPRGEVAHAGDIARQARSMLDRVTDLLEQQGAAPSDLMQAVTYIKEPSFLAPLQEALAEKGFPAGMAHTICVADVCRPAWLCEMESLAASSTAQRTLRTSPGR